MAVEFLERFRLIENKRNLLAGEVFDSKKVLQALKHGFPLLLISPALTKDCPRSGNAIDENDAFLAVNFLQADFHYFGLTCFHVSADERRLDRHFAMAAINQHAKADALGTAQVEKTVHRRTNGTAGVKHIVNDNKVAAVNRKIDFVRMNHGLRSHGGKVVAVQRDIERADGNVDAGRIVNRLSQTLRQGNAPPAYPNQREVVC